MRALGNNQKRQDLEIERDRAEMLVLYTQEKKNHKQIASILNARRQAEYEQAVRDADAEFTRSGRIAAVRPPYTLTRQQITDDLAVIRRGFRSQTSFNLDEMKAEQLNKIDRLEEKAWDALEASAQATTKTVNVISGLDSKRGTFYVDDEGNITPRLIKQTNQRTEQLADPLWAKVILDCIRQRSELFDLLPKADGGNTLVNIPITLYGADAHIDEL